MAVRLDRSAVEALIASSCTEPIVNLSCIAAPAQFTDAETDSLLKWSIPLLTEDGSCSRSDALDPVPFNLSGVLGAPTLALLQRLWTLRSAMQIIGSTTGAQWAGVYRVIPSPAVAAEQTLLKEAYIGSPSRPFFPLTDAFAETSNNSTVGMTGVAIIIHDTRQLNADTPYYVCDNKESFW